MRFECHCPVSKTSKPTLVIGDLHGQYEIAEFARDTEYSVIFLGDYLDSFNRSKKEQIRTLQLVLNSIQNSRARGIMANHDISYLRPELRCGGWNSITQSYIDNGLRNRMEMLLEDYIWCEGFLISHAGVSQRLLNYLQIDLDTYLSRKDFEQIGPYRRGNFECGGLRWCDWREFEPIEGVNQIVGHSRYFDIRNKDNNWCIDVLEDREPQGLFIQDGNVEIINLKDLRHSKYYF